eukprot:598278-Hanusia_phi.AAC.2
MPLNPRYATGGHTLAVRAPPSLVSPDSELIGRPVGSSDRAARHPVTESPRRGPGSDPPGRAGQLGSDSPRPPQ